MRALLLLVLFTGVGLMAQEPEAPPAKEETETAAPEEEAAAEEPAEEEPAESAEELIVEEEPVVEEPEQQQEPETEDVIAAEEAAEGKPDQEGEASLPEIAKNQIRNYFVPDIDLIDFAQETDVLLLLVKIKRGNDVVFSRLEINPYINEEIDYTIQNATINQLLSRMVLDRKVNVTRRDGIVYVDPYVGISGGEDVCLEYVTPDVPIGNIITENVSLTLLFRQIARDQKVNLVVSPNISDNFQLQLFNPDWGLNCLLGFLVEQSVIRVQKIGNFVTINAFDEPLPPRNAIIYDQTAETISFDLKDRYPLSFFASEVMEITGKNVLLRDFEWPKPMLRGFYAALPFDQAMQTIAEQHNLGFALNDGVVVLEPRTQGVTLWNGRFDVWLQGAALGDVINQVSDRTHIPIVVPGTLEGTVTLDVQNQDLTSLLGLILADTDYTYELESGSFVIVTREDIAVETSSLVEFANIRASLVEGMLPDSIIKDKAVIVSNFKEVNGLVFTGEQSAVNRAAEFAKLLDRRVPQVLLEVVMVNFTSSESVDIGMSLFAGSDQQLLPGIDISLEGAPNEDGNYRIGRLPSNFTLGLQALEERGLAKVIKKPLIATLSGSTAELKVGTTVYYKLQSEEIVGDQNPRVRTTEKIESEEANFSLEITPYVIGNGLMTVDIKPNFDSFSGSVTDNVPPPKLVTALESTVRLRDGETIILGGLVENSDSRSNSGLPFISRIPILGALFKTHATSGSIDETYMYVTPRIYYGDENSPEYIRNKDVLDYRLPKKKSKRDRKKKSDSE